MAAPGVTGPMRWAALAAAGACLAAAPSGGLDQTAGAWEMSLDGSHRKCRVTLGSEPEGRLLGSEPEGRLLGPDDAGATRRLRFPAGCRRALPILNATESWGFDNGFVRFLGRDGEPVLAFEPRTEDEGLIARTSAGEIYVLEWKEPLRDVRDRPEQRVAARWMPPLLARPAPPPPTPVDPDKAPPFGAMPGVYVVDRYLEREVCRVRLGAAMLDASGLFEARLLDGCHDAGIQVFDPVAWRYEAGRLVLQARRGHQVTLISEHAGQWRRDPDVGATLVLRKSEP